MLILLGFAFLSGLVTILAPCIWPLLPIVLSASATGGKQKPLGVILGISMSFAIFTLSISSLVALFHFDPSALRLFAVVVITFLGITMIVPRLSAQLEVFVSRFSGRFSTQKGDGLIGGLATGLSLGLVWSPCAGPILATIATLATTASLSWQLVFVTLSYVAGVAIPLFILAQASQALFSKTKFLNKYLGRIQQIFGVIMILTALAIYTNYDKVLQVKLLDAFPSYSHALIKIEDTEGVQKQLDILKKTKDQMADKALEFTGITKWLNPSTSSGQAITLKSLRGKVVLVDFWTYTCINCIRTLPHVVGWDEKYRDKGLVIVGVHTPEFEFEKKTENVEAAIKQYNIKYPVAQDNDYGTWNAYSNHYWPAKYLIDKEGRIVYTHFGEGEYDTTEKKIQELLGISMETNSLSDQTPKTHLSPETYLGAARMTYYYPSRTIQNISKTFSLDPNLPVGFFSLGGDWMIGDEYSVSGQNAVLEINCVASKVFLIMRPPKSGPAKIKIILDGKEIKTVIIDTDKLYSLVDLPEVGSHLLRLEFINPGAEIYAFTFG